MRDAHRMKEKLDLSLDNRQVVSIVIGGLVVLGAVFVLGVVVGKKLSQAPAGKEAPDLLAALDRKSQAMDQVRGTAALTFQDELTRKGLDPIIPDAGPLAAPPQLDPITRKPELPRMPAAGTGGSSPIEKTVAPEKPATTEKTIAEKVQEHVVPPEVKEALIREDPPPPAPPRPSLRDAIARAERAPVQGAPAAGAAAPSSGSFTLQLASLPSRTEAERRAGELREKGYAPYVVSAQVAGKGTWYRVRMGSFGTKDEAQKFLADFKRETRLDAYVTSAP